MGKRRAPKTQANGEPSKRYKIVTVYKQTETIYSNGIRRISPVFLRPTDRFMFASTNTMFDMKTKFKVQVVKKSDDRQPYKPEVTNGLSLSEPIVESVESELTPKEVMDRFGFNSDHSNRKSIKKRIKQMKRAFGRLFRSPIGGKSSLESKDIEETYKGYRCVRPNGQKKKKDSPQKEPIEIVIE